jgi:hypothetical protein
VKTQVLQGGLLEETEPFVKHLVAAKNGETLVKTPQKVPGGLLGLVRCNEVSNIILRIACEVTSGGPTGKPGTQKGKEKGKILEIAGTSLVSNTFTAPKATGCGLLGLLDGIIDSKIGLPSAAGKNTAVLNGKVEIANSEFVEESEEG